jgi:hypothetical protein
MKPKLSTLSLAYIQNLCDAKPRLYGGFGSTSHLNLVIIVLNWQNGIGYYHEAD